MIINFLKEDFSVAKHLEAKNKKNHSEIEYYETDEGEVLCLLIFIRNVSSLMTLY